MLACTASTLAVAGEVTTNSVPVVAPPVGSSTNAAPALTPPVAPAPELWNWHFQNTAIVQGYPGFPAQYSGPNSLPNGGETRETISMDLLAGVRLWQGAEAHVDGLMWQGYGVGNALGVVGFPNGEAFRLGTSSPNVNISRLFVRQYIDLGGETEMIPDDALDLARQVDVSRITLTAGRFSAKDIFDNNAYANDPRTQFMNWALMANESWDYPGDALGYITGFAAELNQPGWTARYGLFQMPESSNGTSIDPHVLQAWGMVTEFEKRYTLADHPGTIRLLAYLNHAHMGNYQQATELAQISGEPADIQATRAYRYKYGFGLNGEQEVVKNVGVFSRLGWSDGQSEAWVFSDADFSESLGVSIKGGSWHRPNDTFGLAGVANGITHNHQEFFQAGGTGILAGDGNLNYAWEQILETYYDFGIWKTLHASLDYQYVTNPAFNQDRGPVSIFGARVHWEF